MQGFKALSSGNGSFPLAHYQIRVSAFLSHAYCSSRLRCIKAHELLCYREKSGRNRVQFKIFLGMLNKVRSETAREWQ